MYMLGVMKLFKVENEGGDCYQAVLHGFTVCSSAFTEGVSFKQLQILIVSRVCTATVFLKSATFKWDKFKFKHEAY